MTRDGAGRRARHLLIIGAQRCGTTWLASRLEAHPQIAMAQPSRPEPKVFCSEALSSRGREWYLDTWFAHATDETLLGEKSTSYLEYSRYPEVADRARAMLGDPLVLVQLRDPIERAISHWAFSTDSGLETRTLADALSANLEGPLPWDPERTSVSPYAYLERGRYIDDLAPWTERFGALPRVVFLEELTAGTAAIRDLYDALGVDPDVTPPPVADPVNTSQHEKPVLDPALRARLRDHFAESDRALAELLGRPLPWREHPEG